MWVCVGSIDYWLAEMFTEDCNKMNVIKHHTFRDMRIRFFILIIKKGRLDKRNKGPCKHTLSYCFWSRYLVDQTFIQVRIHRGGGEDRGSGPPWKITSYIV